MSTAHVQTILRDACIQTGPNKWKQALNDQQTEVVFPEVLVSVFTAPTLSSDDVKAYIHDRLLRNMGQDLPLEAGVSRVHDRIRMIHNREQLQTRFFGDRIRKTKIAEKSGLWVKLEDVSEKRADRIREMRERIHEKTQQAERKSESKRRETSFMTKSKIDRERMMWSHRVMKLGRLMSLSQPRSYIHIPLPAPSLETLSGVDNRIAELRGTMNNETPIFSPRTRHRLEMLDKALSHVM